MERVGRFELRGLLGRGGMGAVWRAHDPRLGRDVALKLIQPSPDGRRQERFLVEARAAAALVHPHVVRVHEIGEHQGQPYLVLDLVEGESLRARLEREGRLPVREAAALVAALAEALAAAHARGISHRDLKPENVLLEREGGQPRLTDFGLARLEEAGRARLTATGELLGTPAYMAPEQIGGDVAAQGPPCDVHALGLVLHELLTGRLPWEEASFPALAAAIVGRAPAPPSRLRPEVPPPLDAVCAACLAKPPGERPPAAEVSRALRAWLDGAAEAAPPASRALLAGGALLGAAALLGLLLAAWPGEHTSPAPAAVAAPPPAPPPASDPEPARPAPDWPGWFSALPAGERPPLPLPERLLPARAPREYSWTLPDGQTLPLVWIPAGAGADGSQVDGFFLGARELSWAEWRGFVEASGEEVWSSQADDMGLQDRRALFQRHPELPALPTWSEARRWCEWAGLRLPTLAEWQRAAALDGPLPPSTPLLEPQPAASGRPGATGCLHLADNVQEWLRDDLAEHPELVVGRLREGEPRDERLLCGGSHIRGASLAPCTALPVDSYSPDGGLRPAVRRPRPQLAWQVEAHAWVPVPAEEAPYAGPLRSYELLRAASQRRLELRLPALELDMGQEGLFDPVRGRGPREALGFPSDWFALEAIAPVELPPGRWILRVDADDAVRVWLGDELLLDVWANGVHEGLEKVLRLPARRSARLRVQYAEMEGYATLRVRLEPDD